MVTPANITPTPLTEGTLYGAAVPLTGGEAALYGGTGAQVASDGMVPVEAGQVVVAVVRLTANGHITGSNAYVFLQTDLGDGVWVDVAWCNTRLTDGSATFVLCGGGAGAMNNAFGPLRNSGSAPALQANGSNAVPLGGRIRFTGFGTSVGGSSSAAGTLASLQATITYKLQHMR